MVENMHAWHDQPFATKRNGFDGLDVELLINREFGVKHIGQLAAWQKDEIYSYGGRQGAADPKFVNGTARCTSSPPPSSAASPAE
jgi:sn-glycerol 3-phosphate transport system substrate-binding protein